MFIREEFVRALDQGGVVGAAKRLWLSMFKKDPANAAKQYFLKLDRDFQGEDEWEIAKQLLIQHRPEVTPTIPVVYNWDYCVKINKGRWGDCCYDWEEWVKEGIAVL